MDDWVANPFWKFVSYILQKYMIEKKKECKNAVDHDTSTLDGFLAVVYIPRLSIPFHNEKGAKLSWKTPPRSKCYTTKNYSYLSNYWTK